MIKSFIIKLFYKKMFYLYEIEEESRKCLSAKNMDLIAINMIMNMRHYMKLNRRL